MVFEFIETDWSGNQVGEPQSLEADDLEDAVARLSQLAITRGVPFEIVPAARALTVASMVSHLPAEEV